MAECSKSKKRPNNFPAADYRVPALTGKAAEIDLRSKGQYESLAAAFHAARYTVEKIDPSTPYFRGAEFFAANPKQKLRALFGPNGVELSGKARINGSQEPWTLTFRLQSYGRAGDLKAIEARNVHADENRVEIGEPTAELVEWWENKDLGFEHGFTINRSPQGNGLVELAIATEGTLCVRQPNIGDSNGIAFVTNDGQQVARYGLIKAWDAKGRSLPASIDLVGEQLALRVSDVEATYPITIDPLFAAVETDLIGNPDLTGELLGSSVAIDGDTIAVTAPADKDPTGAQTGSVYVFERVLGPNNSAQWHQTAKFYGHSDTEGFASSVAVVNGIPVGSPVAVKGNVIVVGAKDASKAYVYNRTGEIWTEQTSLTSGVPGDSFGSSVALSGPAPFLTELFSGGSDSNDTHNQSFLFVPSSAAAKYTMSRQPASVFPTDPTGGTVLAESDDSSVQVNLAPSTSVALFGVAYTSFFVGSNGYITFGSGDSTFAESIANHFALPRISALFDDLTPNPGGQISVKQLSDRVAVTWQNVHEISNNNINNFQVEMFFDGRIRITILNIAATDGLIGLSPGGGVPAGFVETDFTAPYTIQVGAANGGNPYMFAGDNIGWVSQGKLIANPAASLGGAGAVSGNTAVATGSGGDYVFIRTNGTWAQQAKLNPDPMTGDSLGKAVSIDGDMILVGGGFVGNGGSKGAYFFQRNGTTWSTFQKLADGGAGSNNFFGTAVALNGNTAIIGFPIPIHNDFAGPNQGRVFVYTLANGQWNNTAFLSITGGYQSLFGGEVILDTDFGSSLALSGNTIVVGAPYYDTAAGQDAGNATVFVPDSNVPSNWVTQQTLDGKSEFVAGDKFGYSMAVSGDTALIGAPESETLMAVSSGSVYVFVRQNGMWGRQAKLFPEPSFLIGFEQDFGASVAVDGDTAVVSAPALHTSGGGNAFVFVRTGTAWSEQAELLPGIAPASVAITGNLALVGDGAVVHAFTRTGTSWTEDANPIMPADNTSIGRAIAATGTTAVIGASGKAYVFSKAQAGWSQDAVLTPSDGSSGFGASVAIDGSTILVGAPNGTSGPGSAYPFIFTSGTWQQQGKLSAADGMTGDNFGGSVSLKGDVAVVGAPEAPVPALTNPGNAYLFARNAGSWTQQTKLTSGFDRTPGDNFGFSVAISSTNTYSSLDSTLGQISAPFVIDATNRLISQSVLTTTPAQGGRAAYTFTVDNPGDYTIAALVNWPDASSNSFFAAVDVEPTTSNIWTGTITSGLESRPLTWGAETSAHVFTLTAGSHSLIVRGRAANAKLGRISVNAGGSPSSLALVGAPGISGASGDVYTFLVGDLPQVTMQPASQTVLKGSPVTFNITAAGYQPLSYQWRKNGVDIPGATGPLYTIASTDTPDSGNYDVVVSNIGGVVTSASAVLNVNVLSALAQAFPSPPPSAQGFVFVTLSPAGIQSGWRFVGEQLWRNSGTIAGGLTSGDRKIEFRPVPGYIQPLTETITVTSGAPATQVTAEYFPTSGGGQAGGVEVILKPDSIADAGLPVANRGQWRFLGEDDNAWRNSGVTVTGLLPGKYLIECKPIAGRNTPSANVVPVCGDPENPNCNVQSTTTLATITYYSADATVGATPSVLPFQTVSTTQSLPYAYVGQIRSDVGSATGFVVNRRVVATAGHVVFDDGTLSYVTGLQWLFERSAGTYDPVPQIPQGFYVFDGYAAQRTTENNPGQSSVASQNLDVAALYFLADAGRGGYAGYLASDSTNNEFLTSSSLKMLVGYPVNGISSSQQGQMFATPPFNVTFTRVPGADASNNPYRVYTTQDITSAGGNSGGPICVQVNNIYYPAAIYLGGSAQTSVRAIDGKVVDLFGRAQVSGDGGANQVGGGIIQVNTPISGAIFSAAALKVNLSPGSAVTGGAMWSLSPTDVGFASGFERDNLNPVGTYTLYFAPAIGFLTPPPAAITLTAGQLSTVTRIYFGVTTQPVSQIGPAGSNVSFSVTTSGTPTGYQWRRNGVNISGATNSSYTLNNVTSNDTATYSVVVTWTEVAPSTVTGPVSQTSSAATLTVTDTFNSWSSRFFTPTELTNTQVSGPTADPDGDSVPNLLEFAFNLQPRIADRSVLISGTGTSGLPLVRLETINNQKTLTIEFVRRRAAGSPGITYHAEFSGDLTNPNGWSETGTATVTQIDDTWERVKVTDSLFNQTKRFGRVRVTMP